MRYDYKKIRATLGLTQSQAAAAVGAQLPTWSRWERGECEPSPAFDSRLKKLDAKAKKRLTVMEDNGK